MVQRSNKDILLLFGLKMEVVFYNHAWKTKVKQSLCVLEKSIITSICQNITVYFSDNIVQYVR